MVERAGQAIKHLAKSEPLKRKGCGREKCFPCRTGGGNCEKNGVAYRVRCETCRRAGKMTEYEVESGYKWFHECVRTRGCCEAGRPVQCSVQTGKTNILPKLVS